MSSGALGSRLFSFALAQALAEQIEVAIDEDISAFINKGGIISSAGVAALRRQISQKIKGMENLGTVQDRSCRLAAELLGPLPTPSLVSSTQTSHEHIQQVA